MRRNFKTPFFVNFRAKNANFQKYAVDTFKKHVFHLVLSNANLSPIEKRFE